MQKTKNVISLSQNAANRINDLVNKGENKVIGLRVGIKSSGCSGFKYNVEYAYEEKNLEEKIIDKGVTIFIDPTAIMFLMGCEMDWKEDKFSSGFIFNNPNEISRCGCGESFSLNTAS
tara:strand:+ start:153 stop:506 length:354 start_codon:yes stop_codon:yes gene_type:complete